MRGKARPVTIDGNLLLSFSIIVMRYLSSTFMIFANGTFYITLRIPA